MDLAILGAAPDKFDVYEHAVRREYEWVDDDSWKSARSAVLRSFLDRPSIFLTAAEAPARENISRSLERLEGQV